MAPPSSLAGGLTNRRKTARVVRRVKAPVEPAPPQQDDVLSRLVAGARTPSVQDAPLVERQATRSDPVVVDMARRLAPRTLLSHKEAAKRTPTRDTALPVTHPTSPSAAPAPALSSAEARRQAAAEGEEAGEAMAAFAIKWEARGHSRVAE